MSGLGSIVYSIWIPCEFIDSFIWEINNQEDSRRGSNLGLPLFDVNHGKGYGLNSSHSYTLLGCSLCEK